MSILALSVTEVRLPKVEPECYQGKQHEKIDGYFIRRRVMAGDDVGHPAQATLEKAKVHIAVGGKSAFYYLPLTIAEQLGYFKAEGLEVTISDFAGGSQSLRAVVGGSADVVSGAYEHTINMQAKNQILQCFRR